MDKKILLIEDEELIIELLVKKLSGAGFQVFVARDGKEGLEKIAELKPDLVLLDVIMPKLNGFEVLEKKNEDPLLRDIPVMIISNSGQPVEISRAKELGVVDYVIKTEFDPEQVLEKVLKLTG